MTIEEYLELLVILHIEDRCGTDEVFFHYVNKKCNADKFNYRYNILIDKYLNQYAINKSGKSE